MKRLLTLLFACVVTVSLSANPVSKENARKSAERFLQQKGVQLGSEAACARGGRTATGHQTLYVFNTVGDRGFVIVSGDDCAESILGYTTRGSYDEATLPENFRDWLDQMSAEIEAASKLPKPIANEGEIVLAPQKVNIHAAVQPLIITTWNQGNTDNVYNAHLPLVSGQYPCTGCVATAGAQVMYYYRWPEGPTQVVPGYTLERSQGADTSADLPSITFQWDKMKTSYSRRQETDPLTEAEGAVADLMLYCGYAAKMNYGLGGSSASTSTLAKGMCEYFDYNPDTWQTVDRVNYSVVEWDELVYNELANGRPIIYSGSSLRGGHAFICDGYDGAGMYHFNWGWGGSYNGFFKLQATNPYGKQDITDVGYIDDNYCVIGLQPNSWPVTTTPDPSADDEWDVIEVDGIVTRIYQYEIDNTSLMIAFWNATETDAGFGFGLGELFEDGTITVIDTQYESQEDNILGSHYIRSLYFDVSSCGLSEGRHKIVPLNKLKGEPEWKMCNPTDTYFEVVVSGGSYTIIAHPIEDLQISDLDLATPGAPGNYQKARFTVTNNGDNIEKTLYLYVGTEEDMGKYSGSKSFKIASGNTKTFTTYIGALDAGTYTLYLTADYGSSNYLAKKQITIEQDLRATSFDIPGVKFKNSELEVNVTVENYANDYAAPLYLFAGQTGSMDLAYAAGSAIERGGSEVVKFYFKPTASGTWNLCVATDYEGTNVIGQGTVVIDEPPTGKVVLTASNQKAVFGNGNVTYSFTVKNTGETTSYRDIVSWLFEFVGNKGSSNNSVMTSLYLEPGEEKTVTIFFDGLREGVNYGIYTSYYETFDTDYPSQFDRYSFTYAKPSGDETRKGDINADGKVNGTDIQNVINVITDEDYVEAADINKDGKVNGTDIQEIINIIVEEE